jgi:formylglycine-generating enzyme required for sulfatase activity
MKLRMLILIVFLVVLAEASLPQQANPPLTKDQIMDLVKFGMNSRDLAKKIQERGFDFEPTDDYLQALRNAGAQEEVIEALRAARPKPLTREQVGKLVAGGVPSERAAALVKEHGIDFLADEQYLDTLRVAGGEDTLITALREASAAATAQLVITTSPSAEVYLDGAPQGPANGQGELTMKAKLGAHALKVTLAGKKDFEQSITLAGRQATKIEARLADLATSPGTVRENPRDGLKYVWIPPGTFMMGCSPGDNECEDDEKPSHGVTITKGFWMGQTEVTVGAYKRFAAATGRQMPPAVGPAWANDNMPIVNATWEEVRDYCTWAGGRLPTEAEWEYAARGGSTKARYGDLNEVAWTDTAHEVGQKRPNGFGLFDVLGNVTEAVNDWYDGGYYKSSPSQDPTGPTSGSHRSLRGGSYAHTDKFSRATQRDLTLPQERSSSVGVRCAQEADRR